MRHLLRTLLLLAGLTGCGVEGPAGMHLAGPHVLQEEWEGEHVYTYTVAGFDPQTQANWNFLTQVADGLLHEKQQYGTYTIRFLDQQTGQQFYVVGGAVQHDEIWLPRIAVAEKGRFVDSLKPRQELLKQHPLGW